ncbi:hypothetical protein KKA15_03420 [Patescibacteria group bacterium]|nr:hypothetical protein [Patescibacteria group bacterium]
MNKFSSPQYKKLIFLGVVCLLLLAGCKGKGVSRSESFIKPDIKDDFCGVEINFQYCKCAFHDEYCDAIGMDQKEANKYVQSEYKKWLDEKFEAFITTCVIQNAYIENDTCNYCEDGYTASEDGCVDDSEGLDEEEEDEETKLPDGPYNEDCTLKQDEYDRDWKKYSDIDERLDYDERSYEAQNALVAYDAMIDLMAEGFELERDIELETQMQGVLGEYREALVQNIKTNLLKSFWRLSWITYSTIQNAKGLGSSYSTLLTTGATVETVGAGLKVVQGLTPANSALAIDTRELSGKAKSVGANVALEAIDSLGDPIKVATEFVKSSTLAALPSADLTPAEINILRDQHLTKGVIDDVLKASIEANAPRQARLAEIETQVAQYQQEIDSWESKEKERVAASLVDSCKTLMKQTKDN